ncbi:MAG: hypothetical protein ACRC4N_07795, partial [Gammaproteobacteria bacterium]
PLLLSVPRWQCGIDDDTALTPGGEPSFCDRPSSREIIFAGAGELNVYVVFLLSMHVTNRTPLDAKS